MGEQERVQAFRAAIAVVKLLLEVSSAGSGAGLDFAEFLQPDLGEANHDPPKQAQHQGGFWVAHPALILSQGDVEGVVQGALNHPVAALEFEESSRIELVEGVAANQANDLGGFLALALHPPFEPRNGLGSRKARLLRVTSRQSSTRISARRRLYSRVIACMRAVGRGGKGLLGQQRRENFNNFLLVAFDGQQVVATAFKEDLSHGLDLGMRGVGQHNFIHHFLLSQLLVRRRDLVAGSFDDRGTQPAASAADRANGLHVGMANFLAVQNGQPVLYGAEHLFLPQQEDALQVATASHWPLQLTA